MKEFLQLMRRFVSPYKKYIGWAVLLNILSAVFNVFSFTFFDSYSEYPVQDGRGLIRSIILWNGEVVIWPMLLRITSIIISVTHRLTPTFIFLYGDLVYVINPLKDFEGRITSRKVWLQWNV